MGVEVKTVNKNKTEEKQSFNLSVSDLSAGFYFVYLKTSKSYEFCSKLVVVK